MQNPPSTTIIYVKRIVDVVSKMRILAKLKFLVIN
jgi:hypothetical protein